jgi:hypothetical protein
MALSGETPNVIPEGFALLLPATLQILRVARPHVCAIKVADEDLLDILPGVNRVSGQVIKPGPSHVDQLNGEELDDEEAIIRPTSLACEAIVLQEDAEICFAVIINNVIWCSKTFREARIAHAASKHFRPWPFGAKATPFSIIVLAEVQVAPAVLGMLPLMPPVSLTV